MSNNPFNNGTPPPKTAEEIFRQIEHTLRGMWSTDPQYDDVPKATGVRKPEPGPRI